jgi:hypothetical protein
VCAVIGFIEHHPNQTITRWLYYPDEVVEAGPQRYGLNEVAIRDAKSDPGHVLNTEEISHGLGPGGLGLLSLGHEAELYEVLWDFSHCAKGRP